ncbi:hypothetical protein DNTS_013787, partial [Danionella cerebrum]
TPSTIATMDNAISCHSLHHKPYSESQTKATGLSRIIQQCCDVTCCVTALVTCAMDCKDASFDCAGEVSKEVKVEDEGYTSPMRERRRVQLNQRPGSYSPKGSPNMRVQIDRLSRHLNKKKKQHRPRIGSYTLLSHDLTSNPFQVVSIGRHIEEESRPNALALKKRPRRSAPKRKRTARIQTCS